MKLSHAILAVMLDGKEHPQEEIVARVRHFVQPNLAVRLFAHAVMSSREYQRKDRVRTLPTRKPDVEPEGVEIKQAVDWVVVRSVKELARDRKSRHMVYLENVNEGWRLRAEARAYMKRPQVAGGIAGAIKRNLLAKGELI